MHGHHVYVKGNKVLAGSVPGMNGAFKKATKAQLDKHQQTVDAKPKKGAGKDDKAGKEGSKRAGGAGVRPNAGGKPSGSGSKPVVAGKGADNGPGTGSSKGKKAGSGSAGGVKEPPKLVVSAKPKEAAPKAKKAAVADVRHEAQANRALAYDVGDKVGGARKDLYTKSFTADPTTQNLEALEKVAPEVAQKMCVKANILPKIDFEAEHKNGVEVNAAMLKQLIYDRISPKPQGDRAEDRMAYLQGINKLHRIIAPIKTWDELRNTISELGRIASAGSGLEESKRALANAGKYGNSYTNTEYYENRIAKATEAKKMLDFSALGDKLESFFTKSDSRIRTFQTIRDKKLDWANYFKPSEDGADEKDRGATRGAGRKKWERMAVSEHQRAGGKATTVKKPEDMVRQFGMKGVEFGNWVDDASGLYHLKRSAEAFHDLADVLGVDDKDISLNGRLSMAFGARGKAGAVAHYEPDRKVINMTKHGGAGSLAHEWGHAMDNIMYMYSHGGIGSMGLASDAPRTMGEQDPELKRLYDKLMDAVQKPTPGQPGGVRKVAYDTEANPASNYYPQMRRDVEGGMSMSETLDKWQTKHQANFDASMRAIDSMRSRYSAKDLDKRVMQAQRELKSNLKALPHQVAYEFKRKGGGHIKGEIEMPTGQSEYYTRMQEFDGSSKPYYAQGCEMFARVFESLIEDKLTAKKRKNNYLVWDTKTSKGNLDAPFPVGEERKHMHAAMENLLQHISKGKVLKKALEFDLQKSGDYTDRLAAMQERRDPEGIESGTTKRFAYEISHTTDPSEVLFIPVNRLHMVYQTDAATDWDKVRENQERIRNGEAMEPITIGYDYDVHDGHHRWLAAQEEGHTHVPCVVGGTDELRKQDALGQYRELWKSLERNAEYQRLISKEHPRKVLARYEEVLADTGNKEEAFNYTVEDFDLDHGEAEEFYGWLKSMGQDIPKAVHALQNNRTLAKSIIPDPVAMTSDPNVMYRGIGQKEMDFINQHGYIQTKGKGNDDDKSKRTTCFTNLYEQALGYAISQYTLYGETAAYVLALPKPPWVYEDEFGELLSEQPVPFAVGVAVQVPNPADREDVNVTPFVGGELLIKENYL